MPRPLEKIVALQEVLDELRETDSRLHDVPDWMRELHDEHSSQRARIEALERAIEQAAQERRAAEAGIEDLRARLKRYQEQINQVSTQREYGALLHEIDTTKSQITALEEEGIQAMERREQAEKELAELRQEFADLDRRYAVELEKWEAEKPDLKRQLEDLTRRAEELRQTLPRPVLGQYERIAARYGGQALAPVRTVDRARGATLWHCGVCNFNVRPQMVVEIRNSGGLVQCDSCKRFLHFAEEAEEVPEEVGV